MSENVGRVEDAIEAVVEFRNERDRKSHHTPKELATALSLEASELEEEFLRKDPDAVSKYLDSPAGRVGVRDEVGGVLIYALLFCESAEILPLEAIESKLSKSRRKYPSDQNHSF